MKSVEKAKKLMEEEEEEEENEDSDGDTGLNGEEGVDWEWVDVAESPSEVAAREQKDKVLDLVVSPCGLPCPLHNLCMLLM